MDLHRAGFLPIKTLEFGENRYLVVETPADFDRSHELLAVTDGEEVTLDFPIVLDEPAPTPTPTPTPIKPPPPPVTAAWHVTKMQYAKLPIAKGAGKGVTVAVLDTGIDLTHPALKDHLWVNKKEIAGNGIDDDSNGYVDDVNGYSFVNQSHEVHKTYNPHGTHCSGIIAADPQDATVADSARGVAPGVKIMMVHIIEPKKMETFMSDAAAATKYAVDNGAKVLSNSWRVYSSWKSIKVTPETIQILKDAVQYATKKGAIYVAAAGNETKDIDVTHLADPIVPAGFGDIPGFVGVAASKEDGSIASFSNYGAKGVLVAAPGDAIMSTDLGGKWRSMSGTSMAAPLVAGILARGLSAGMTPKAAIQRLHDTSDVTDVWKSKVSAGGVVNPVEFHR